MKEFAQYFFILLASIGAFALLTSTCFVLLLVYGRIIHPKFKNITSKIKL